MYSLRHDRLLDRQPAGARHASPGKVLPGDTTTFCERRQGRFPLPVETGSLQRPRFMITGLGEKEANTLARDNVALAAEYEGVQE